MRSQAEQKAKNEVQKRYRRFLDHRKEALFRDTQFTGLLLSTNLELTRKAAEGALGVFAQRGARMTGSWAIFPRRSRASSRPRSGKAATSCSWSWPKWWPARIRRRSTVPCGSWKAPPD